jgi:hypothetical protein
MWLRRRQQAGESRAPLRAARDTFDALGADAWAERARRELRAAGERSGQPARGRWTYWPRKNCKSRGWPQKG